MSKSLAQNSRIIAKKGIIQGREALAFFCIVEGAQGYSVRLVGVRYTEDAAPVALPTAKAKSAPIVSIQSPYFNSSENLISDFSFLISQPARAPSF